MHIVIVHSLHFGGTGKTTISLTLARLLAQSCGVLYITSEPAVVKYYNTSTIDDVYNIRILGNLIVAGSPDRDKYNINSLLVYCYRLCNLLRDRMRIEFAILDVPAGYVPDSREHVNVLVMKPIPAHATYVAKHVDDRTILIVNMVPRNLLRVDKLVLHLGLRDLNCPIIPIEKVRHNFKPWEEHAKLSNILMKRLRGVVKHICDLAHSDVTPSPG
ncbi:MAG: ArsA family ATPase [Crenarchaeota archaeon]|nr:ArsA family ATPase [Thermoproteota archaeon]